MLKKGWKQKHESANIEKQGQMFFFFFSLFSFGYGFKRGDPVTCQVIKNMEWKTPNGRH